jgi:hypothetical protein
MEECNSTWVKEPCRTHWKIISDLRIGAPTMKFTEGISWKAGPRRGLRQSASRNWNTSSGFQNPIEGWCRARLASDPLCTEMKAERTVPAVQTGNRPEIARGRPVTGVKWRAEKRRWAIMINYTSDRQCSWHNDESELTVLKINRREGTSLFG